ncbi:MAG: class I SAM-dependent methyltransferase [Acidobacteriota bacterium]
MAAQSWNPETYARNARFVSELGLEVLELLSPQPGERVLDLGCGDGALTERLVCAGCSVIGVDSSAEQVAAARMRGLDARVANAESLPFEGEFHAVFSNAALHWIRDAGAVVASVHRALKPGGRFVGELGGSGNVMTRRTALAEALYRRGVDAAALDPWMFPTVEQYRTLLESDGFAVKTIALFARPTALPTGMPAWLDTFAQSFLAVFEPGERQKIIDEICATVRPYLYDSQRGWFADYVRLRFAAQRPLSA